jgi:hypothetical protein
MTHLAIEPYPFGNRFAVTLTDDTDRATLAEVEPVYACLAAHGLRSTKTVWPLAASDMTGRDPRMASAGDTLENTAYRAWCQRLQAQGFEIALHTASGGNSRREQTVLAYQRFEAYFGHPPHTNIMHARNRENIYWGKAWTPNHRLLARLIALVEPGEFLGHVVGSPYYWGDLCRQQTRYVRHFETLRANTLAFDPATPYYDPAKPDVNWWFSSSYGAGVRLFALLAPANVAQLAAQRGASIIHCYLRHYARPQGGGRFNVHPRFEALVQALAAHADGWYVPAVELLDRLRVVRQLKAALSGNQLTLTNTSSLEVLDLGLRLPEAVTSVWRDGVQLEPNGLGQVNLGRLGAGQSASFNVEGAATQVEVPAGQPPNYPRLFAGYCLRILWQVRHGRRGRRSEVTDPPWVRALWEPAARASQGG